ncbi:DUF3307 domain-containing protein [Nocardiopsis flavescens]|uniref:DUF3307 domain-containing protein n=1 Tax=Nocardiopsis flavescens TaxID=758803 RepID=UPI003652E06D
MIAGTRDAARFAAVAATLTVAHLIGDYVLQTDHQADRKPCRADRSVECGEVESWAANQSHVATYRGAQIIALVAADRILGLGLSPGRVAAGVAVSWITHSVIDRRWPVRVWMDRTGSAAFRERGGAAHVDQTLHHSCLWASALIISGGTR